MFALPDRINSVQLVLEADAHLLQVEAKVRERLPGGLSVQPPATRGALGRVGVAPFEGGLACLGVGSLVAGAFVILNSFLMNLAERRRQLATLRAVGATRIQVTRLLLREAMLLGSFGTILGIATGLALSAILRRMMSELLGVSLPDTSLSSEPFIVALVLGPGMALAATVVPAWRAGRRSPLEDLLDKHGARSDDSRRWPCHVGLVLLVAVPVTMLGMVHNWFEPSVAYTGPAMGMFLVGCVLIIPMVLSPLEKLADVLVRRLFDIEGGLALRHLVRHKVRTALTVGILVVAVVFSVGFGQSILNSFHHVNERFDAVIHVDFYIRAGWPDPTGTITTVGKMIISQAFALGIISLVPGALAGITLAYMVNLATYPLTGQIVNFRLDPAHISGCLVAGLAIPAVAALLPARRAARLQIVRAIQYE